MLGNTVLYTNHDVWFPLVVIVHLVLLLGFNSASAKGLSPSTNDFEHTWKCVPIKLDFCRGIGYNQTIEMTSTIPNPHTGKNSQEESLNELNHYLPLLKTKCSKNLRLLLCSVYLPYCDNKHDKGIIACQPMCEEVKSNCVKHLKKFHREWPEVLRCDKFPARNTDKVFCLPGDEAPAHTTQLKVTETTLTKTNKRSLSKKPTSLTISSAPTTQTSVTGGVPISKEKYCKVFYSRNVKNYIFVEKIQSCALECMKDGLFKFDEKQLTEKWLSALACICGLLCVASLLCVMLNYQETCFPERSIVFIAICYLFYSLGYVIRIVYSREGVTCQEENGRRYLLVDGSGNVSCAATFLLAYCFSMVQNIWWVILCLTWFLSAGMRWTSEAIRSKSFIFHSFAWGVPCCKTVIVLVWRKIDVNELTGICSIGNRYENLLALRWLVLGPLFVYLIMATMFLLFGLICLFRLPAHNPDQLASRKKVKQLLLPVGTYAAIHTLFSTFILASYFYEYVNKNTWYHDPRSTGPNFTVFLIRIISDFSIGISAATWLLLVHGPRLHRKMKVKLYQTDLLLPRDSAHRMPEHMKHHTSTNETSI